MLSCHLLLQLVLDVVLITNNLSYIIKIQMFVIVDAGIGSPKDACHAMELGADAILLNTAVSGAKDPVKMAEAMKLGIHAGRLSYESGRIQ